MEMNNLPLVSIIICTYNRSSLLAHAIYSVLKQTYNNIEIVIVDDCSTDNTSDIVKDIKIKHQNILYLRNDRNQGLSFSRNKGISNCNGTYIATMDDDDEWIDKEKILKQLNAFKNTKNENIGIICTGIRVYTYDGKTYEKNYFKDKTFKQRILQGNGIIHTSTVLIKKEILDKIGGFDEKIFRGVDSDFYRKVILNGYDIEFLNEISTKYYLHSGYRITKMTSKHQYIADIKSRYRTLCKYWKAYFNDPKSFIYHLKCIIYDTIGILKLLLVQYK